MESHPELAVEKVSALTYLSTPRSCQRAEVTLGLWTLKPDLSFITYGMRTPVIQRVIRIILVNMMTSVSQQGIRPQEFLGLI